MASKNRIDLCFEKLKKESKSALIAFVTAGDPGLEETLKLVLALEQAGVNIVELGVPFSDPIADGPVIQRSSERALKAGTTVAGILHLVKQIRERSQIPLLLMGYYNPIYQYGVEGFARDLSQAGGDGCLVVDLPPEESGEFQALLREKNLHQIFLLTPTSSAERIQRVSARAAGFLYYVSLEGTTGAALEERSVGMSSSPQKQDPLEFVGERLKQIRKVCNLPLVVGFGIRDRSQVLALNRFADGVVIGSALIQNLEGRAFSEGLQRASAFIRELASGP